MKPLIVDDDPFLTESPNGHGVYYDFEQFKKVHQLIAGAGEIHTIAIIAGEIENHPEMKEYILERKAEFGFGLHGWLHERYSEWQTSAIVVSLGRARRKIFETFGEWCTEYYPTWNKRSPALYEACKSLDLLLNDDWMTLTEALTGEQKKAIRFHSWNQAEVDQLKKYLNV